MDLEQRIEKLLDDLEKADTDGEITRIETKLRVLRRLQAA